MSEEIQRKRVFLVVTGTPNLGTYPNLRIRIIDADKRVGEGDLPRMADAFVIDIKFMSHKVATLVRQWCGFIGARCIEVKGERYLREELEKLNKEL